MCTATNRGYIITATMGLGGASISALMDDSMTETQRKYGQAQYGVSRVHMT